MTHLVDRKACFDTDRPSGKIDTAFLSFVREKAKAHFSQVKGSHDWDHTRRVHRLCQKIGRAEGSDPLVTQAAAYLHDIGRIHQDRGRGTLCHAEKGAAMAQEIIAGSSLDDARRKNIIHCIAAHRFRQGETPRTREAKVLFDADKLDAIGAIGVARAFLFAGEWGARLHSPEIDVVNEPAYSVNDTGYREYLVKLSNIRDRVLTNTGRCMANERHRFMVCFFDRFLEEHEGER